MDDTRRPSPRSAPPSSWRSATRARAAGRGARRRGARRRRRGLQPVPARLDLSRVNAHPGEWVEVDPLLVAATEVAVEAARATGGLVHPLLGRQLVELGYDRDFGELVDLATGRGDGTEPPHLHSWADRSGSTREARCGSRWDIARPRRDRQGVGRRPHRDGVRGPAPGSAVVSVGGDLRIARAVNGPGRWPSPSARRPPDTVVAWTGRARHLEHRVRRWTRAGVRRHHLLDPRTGLPAREVWRTVSATGPTCTAANTASTAAIVLGEEAPAWLARTASRPAWSHRRRGADGRPWPADTEGSAA